MPQSARKNRNDSNPSQMPPLDFTSAVPGFSTDDQFHVCLLLLLFVDVHLFFTLSLFVNLRNTPILLQLIIL